MSCEQRPGEVVSRRLRCQFASRHQAAPGMQAARLVSRDCWHTHNSTQSRPCEAGRLFQRARSSSGSVITLAASS